MCGMGVTHSVCISLLACLVAGGVFGVLQAVLTCECSETCIVAMHVFSQGDLISIAQFDLDQHQNISSPQTECNSLLSLCPYIKHHKRAFKVTTFGLGCAQWFSITCKEIAWTSQSRL
jgi:ABC-type uncharacterized transport system permease subunit